MNSILKRLPAFFLALVLLLSLLPMSASAAGNSLEPDALKALLSSVELHPQETGYEELDALLEEILSPYENSDTYTKLKAAYDWLVLEVDYSWAPYSQNWAPAYDCFVPQHELTYPEGLQEAVPYEVANRTYHALKYKEGICYDYGAAFAVMARYMGINAYVHTGNFVFEAAFGSGNGHHGWAELVIGGKSYIFDPQRDYRMSADGTTEIPYLYFGIPYENAWRYTQETEANEARDAQFLPVEAERKLQAVIHATATESGSVTGGGTYEIGESVTVTATGLSDFLGWYDENGTLLSTSLSYTFTAQRSVTLRAVFEGELFSDISAKTWYRHEATEAALRGIINGTEPFIFDGEGTLTRAMAVTIIARAEGEESSEVELPFEDVKEKAWYIPGLSWAYENGIVNGMKPTRFAPDEPVTREQFITMLLRYAVYAGLNPERAELVYTDTDEISAYAREAMEQAQSLELLTGYPDGSVCPQNLLTRAEGVTLLMRLLRAMEAE